MAPVPPLGYVTVDMSLQLNHLSFYIELLSVALAQTIIRHFPPEIAMLEAMKSLGKSIATHISIT